MLLQKKNICKPADKDGFIHFYSSVISNTIFMKFDRENEILSNNNIYKIRNNISENGRQVCIVHTNDTLDKYTQYMYAVHDPMDHRRFFIGIVFGGSNTSSLISGLFVYFDDNGSVSLKNIVNSILCNYEYRNGIIDEKNTFLYNQTLLMHEVHRDSNNYIITICCFGYENDELLGKSTEHTQIKSSFYSINASSIQNKRWLLCNDKMGDQYIIDLGSVCIINEDKDTYSVYSNKNYIYYSLYHANRAENIDDVISKLESTTPENAYDNGYPMNCVKCRNQLNIAWLYIGNSHQALGSGYCPECMIRYSKTNKAWLCCKYIEIDEYYHNIKCCSNILNTENGYVCEIPHCIIDGKYTNNKNSSKYKPYKESININIDTKY